MQYDLATIRDFIRQQGPVRVARQAGLAKATLLPAAAGGHWNPKHDTLMAVAAVMSGETAAESKKDAAA